MRLLGAADAPTVVTSSERQTEELGRRLGKVAGPGLAIGLVGELGSGKTVLVRGLARGLGYRGTVISPTFVLLMVYPTAPPLYHLDAYRLTGPGDLDLLGLEGVEEGILVVEWADRVGDALPADRLTARLDVSGDETRAVSLVGGGPRAGRVVKELLAELRRGRSC